MADEEMLKKALRELEAYTYRLGEAGGLSKDRCAEIWDKITSSENVLTEYSYFHDFGDFLGRYDVCGFTLPDIVAWQVDHFKAYMDRDDKNRYNNERLLLESFEILVDMEKDPKYYAEKMAMESGQDF